ncbi:MAG: hypothetical protein R6X12_02265 [bacterium]
MKRRDGWTARELAVVDRFVRALGQGRYVSSSEAARACHAALAVSSGGRARRSVSAVRYKLGERRLAAGVSAPGYRWRPAELDVIRRWVAKFADNPSLDVPGAVRGCVRELGALRRSQRDGPRLPARSSRTVNARLSKALRAAGVGARFHRRRLQEMKAIRRYARAYLAGRYPSMREAARACRRELARTDPRPRPFYGIYWMLYTAAHELGLPKLKHEWTPAERRALNRHLRLLFEGRHKFSDDAAQACFRELGGSRTYKAVRFALRTEATRTGLPRSHSWLTKTEERLVERYAMMVHNGALPHWRAAAEQCLAAIGRRVARLARTGPLKLRRLPSHTLDTIHMAILNLAHQRGLRGPRNPHWTAAEQKLAAGWVKWYDRYRRVRRLAPLKQASEGLQAELADRGFHRSVAACSARVKSEWERQALR